MQIIKIPLTRFICCSCEHVMSSQAFVKHLEEKLGGLEIGKKDPVPLLFPWRLGVTWKWQTLVIARVTEISDPWSSTCAYSFNFWRHIRERRPGRPSAWGADGEDVLYGTWLLARSGSPAFSSAPTILPLPPLFYTEVQRISSCSFTCHWCSV